MWKRWRPRQDSSGRDGGGDRGLTRAGVWDEGGSPGGWAMVGHENRDVFYVSGRSDGFISPKQARTTQKRPIGIPTLEDKVLQRAVVMLLEPIYEQDFYPGSHGFRPGRGAHGALEELWKGTMNTDGGWVLEVDISKFFDTLDHKHLRELVQVRLLHDALKVSPSPTTIVSEPSDQDQ